MAERVARRRGGFVTSGLVPGDRVAILLKNSVELVCFDQAALSLGLVTVPLHATDGPHNWANQLAVSSLRLLLVGHLQHGITPAPIRERFPCDPSNTKAGKALLGRIGHLCQAFPDHAEGETGACQL